MKISLSNLFNYFFVSGDSKQIKNFPQKKWYFDHNSGGGGPRPLCGAHHPKVPLFLTPPLTLYYKLMRLSDLERGRTATPYFGLDGLGRLGNSTVRVIGSLEFSGNAYEKLLSYIQNC